MRLACSLLAGSRSISPNTLRAASTYFFGVYHSKLSCCRCRNRACWRCKVCLAFTRLRYAFCLHAPDSKQNVGFLPIGWGLLSRFPQVAQYAGGVFICLLSEYQKYLLNRSLLASECIGHFVPLHSLQVEVKDCVRKYSNTSCIASCIR